MIIYKLLGADEWADAKQAGEFRGSGIDLVDGYVHLSTAEQVAETAARHFRGRRGLVMLAVDADRLGEHLRWETSRGGALFPHLYAAMPLDAVIEQAALAEDLPVADAVRRVLAGG